MDEPLEPASLRAHGAAKMERLPERGNEIDIESLADLECADQVWFGVRPACHMDGKAWIISENRASCPTFLSNLLIPQL